MKSFNLLVTLPLIFFGVSHVHAETLSNDDMPKVMASKGTAAFLREYKGKNVSINGPIKYLESPDENNPFIWFTVDAISVPVLCPVRLEKSKVYDDIREGDVVTIVGLIDSVTIKFNNKEVLSLQENCIITKN